MHLTRSSLSPSRAPPWLGLAVALVAPFNTGCASPTCSRRAPSSAGPATCALPGYPQRDYDIHLPTGWEPTQALPVVLFFHGGGGRKDGVLRTSCPGGNTRDPQCLDAIADRERFILVVPDGTPNRLNMRTWNAGGGQDGTRCCCGKACADGVDDVQYVRDLLADMSLWLTIDRTRIHATGISNGGAMSHRLACDLSDQVASIAAVAGANQVAAGPGCNPGRAVPVLHIHGSEDPCWPYDGGHGDVCVAAGQSPGDFVSVEETITGANGRAGWVTRNGCQSVPQSVPLPDTWEDGCQSTETRYSGCRDGADVVLLRIEGGGHTWPDGQGYLPTRVIGPVTRDFNGSERVWEFFKAHPMPGPP